MDEIRKQTDPYAYFCLNEDIKKGEPQDGAAFPFCMLNDLKTLIYDGTPVEPGDKKYIFFMLENLNYELAELADRAASFDPFDLIYWDEDRHALIHAIEDGKPNTMVTKFPNMFTILYGYTTEQERADILRHVLLSDEVEAITTPYMRFYELEALCMSGCQDAVLPEIKAYWGGMLKEGATTFWEKYIPTEEGREHLAMYGRPYGKSLCHAWGASPIYLLGRYFLGVQPTSAGYETYEVRPILGGLQWMDGKVPTPFGCIHVRIDKDKVVVESDGGKGTLIHGRQRIEIPAKEKVVSFIGK